jgi:hypothetical protein
MPKKTVLVATLLVSVVMSSSLAVATQASGAASPALPNLVIDTARVQSSIVFKTTMFTAKDCAYVENSLTGTGKRTLMRFDVSAANRGTAPLVLGNPVNNPLFVYSPCHKHYHFSGYALYELFSSDPRTTPSPALVTGRKQAFCLEDFEPDPLAASPGPAVYACTNQGISVGWEDTYGSYLDGQWLDITDIAPGNYWLRVIINPYNVAASPIYDPRSAAALAIQESDYSDNVAVVPVTIPTKISGGPARN